MPFRHHKPEISACLRSSGADRGMASEVPADFEREPKMFVSGRVSVHDIARKPGWIACHGKLHLRAERDGPGMADVLDRRAQIIAVGLGIRRSAEDQSVKPALVVELEADAQIRRHVVGDAGVEFERAYRIEVAERVLLPRVLE